ncbi:class I SAM-dependent methyltransferase [bacterium]|nr:class I SAM-dependent methyltransferase [bacterium]
MNTKELWKSPIYQFRIPTDTAKTSSEMLKEIVVDVTTSAPSFEDPGKTLSRILNESIEYLKSQGKQTNTVLDFGAGKLRNTIYLLQKKHKVTAVEFEKLSKESNQGQRLLEKANGFKSQFKELVFPDQFIQSTAKFDLALLINVLNIMPVPAERLLVLQYCYQKIKEDGYLLWYTQYGDYDQNKRCTTANVLGDGYYIGKNSKFKSFYREFSTHEIDQMLLSCGFVLEKSFPVSHNQARLYRKVETNVLKQVLHPSLIQKCLNIKRGVPKPDQVKPKSVKRSPRRGLQEPESEKLASESLYINRLKAIKPGKKQALEYQKLVHLIFSKIFANQFSKIKFEETLNEGRKRIDLVAINSASKGFFEELSSKHQIKCGYIPIECKNYTAKLGNPEFDQIGGRLNKTFGLFGFLVYRDGNPKVALKQCQDRLDDEKHIISFDDNDLIKLLQFSQKSELDAIEDMLNSKFISLIGRK